MTKQADRVARMEAAACPPPPQRVFLTFDNGDGGSRPIPENVTDYDLLVTVVGVQPELGRLP